MKDDILTAVADFNVPSTAPNVAPIAPLPSRLSFCLSPQRQQQFDTALATTNEVPSSTTIGAKTESDHETSAFPVDPQEREVIVSPNKKLLNGGGESSGGGCSLSMTVAVKRSPTVRYIFLFVSNISIGDEVRIDL